MKDDRLHNLLLELFSGRVPTEAARKDFEGREIVATPFDGCYGQAGWVICVNGSPPRGCIVALETRDHRYVPASIFYLEMDKSRRLGTMQANVVRDYIAKLASADRNAPAAESGVSGQPTASGCNPMADASVFTRLRALAAKWKEAGGLSSVLEDCAEELLDELACASAALAPQAAAAEVGRGEGERA